MPRAYKRTLGYRTYKSYREDILNKALGLREVAASTMSFHQASRTFNNPVCTLFNKLQKKHNKRRSRPTAFSDIEEATFCKHIEAASDWGFPFDKFDTRRLAQTYMNTWKRQAKQFLNNSSSHEWSPIFLKRHEKRLSQPTCQNIKRSRAMIGYNMVFKYFENLENTLKEIGEFIPSTHLFNYDKKNFSRDPGIKKCVI